MAANKNDIKTNITLILTIIKDRLPGLNLYRHIYNDKYKLDVRF